jgi:hypothetical protein
MFRSFSFLLLLFVTTLLRAQGPPCGTDDIIIRNPFLLNQLNNRVACDAPEIDLDTAQVLTIPVVVHVLHLGEAVGEGTNISDEQVLSCIENLNHRFRGDVTALAALTDQYDEYELSLVNDAKIEFCLASRDPGNLPTTGINRIDCSTLMYINNFSGQTSTAYYAEKGISNGSQYDIPLQGIPDAVIKQSYGWPVDKYFNMYVVSEINGNDGGGGVQGYSYVGSLGLGANGYRYGPVCLYNVTGTTGTLKSSRELNSTWAHEIGHALDLYHTFGVPGNTIGCGPETNSCTQGDQVPDTPPTLTNQSCNVSACPDALIENYMDYTGEDCKTNFTQNQIERMRHEIYTGLPYLLNTLSCQSPVGQDLAILNVTLPDSWCRPTIDFSVTIANQGGGPILPGALLDINGEYYDIPILEGGEYYTFNFTEFELPESGNVYTYIIYDADEYPVNDGVLTTVEITEENWAEITITTDFFANEIEWFLGGTTDTFFLGEDNYPTGQETYTYETCLTDGCYVVSISDTAGDGLCTFDLEDDGICDYGGSFNLTINGIDIIDITEENSDFGSNYTNNFCTYYCPPEPCPADLDGDGIVGIHDLLTFLTVAPGNITECSPLDFNNDLFIDVDDALTFLNYYGYNCATGEYYTTEIPEEVFNMIANVTELDNKPVADMSNACIVGDPMFFDITGRAISVYGDLAPGIYIVVENWSNGNTTSRKVYIGGN